MVCFTSGQKRNEDMKTKLAKIVMSIDSILLNGVKNFNCQQGFVFIVSHSELTLGCLRSPLLKT